MAVLEQKNSFSIAFFDVEEENRIMNSTKIQKIEKAFFFLLGSLMQRQSLGYGAIVSGESLAAMQTLCEKLSIDKGSRNESVLSEMAKTLFPNNISCGRVWDDSDNLNNVLGVLSQILGICQELDESTHKSLLMERVSELLNKASYMAQVIQVYGSTQF